MGCTSALEDDGCSPKNSLVHQGLNIILPRSQASGGGPDTEAYSTSNRTCTWAWEDRRKGFCSLIHFPDALMARDSPDKKPEVWNSTPVFHMSGKCPSTWDFICHFPRRISRKLDQKRSDKPPWRRKWINLLCHTISPQSFNLKF